MIYPNYSEFLTLWPWEAKSYELIKQRLNYLVTVWRKPGTEHQKYRAILIAQDLSLGRRFTFQQENTGVAWGNVKTLEWHRHIWTWLCTEAPHPAWRSLNNSAKTKKTSKRMCAKLVGPFPRRLEAVFSARGALTKYWVKALNTCAFY